MDSIKTDIVIWSLNSLVVQLPFLLVTFWALPRSWKKIKAAFSFKEREIVQPWISLLIFLATRIVVLFTLDSSSMFVKRPPSFLIFPYFVLACIVAPIAEESFFRYLIFEIFDKNTLVPYILSFFGFLLVHVGYLTFPLNLEIFLRWILAYGIMTFSLIGIYRRSNWNLAFPILYHFLNNLFVFFWMLSR